MLSVLDPMGFVLDYYESVWGRILVRIKTYNNIQAYHLRSDRPRSYYFHSFPCTDFKMEE